MSDYFQQREKQSGNGKDVLPRRFTNSISNTSFVSTATTVESQSSDDLLSQKLSKSKSSIFQSQEDFCFLDSTDLVDHIIQQSIQRVDTTSGDWQAAQQVAPTFNNDTSYHFDAWDYGSGFGLCSIPEECPSRTSPPCEGVDSCFQELFERRPLIKDVMHDPNSSESSTNLYSNISYWSSKNELTCRQKAIKSSEDGNNLFWKEPSTESHQDSVDNSISSMMIHGAYSLHEGRVMYSRPKCEYSSSTTSAAGDSKKEQLQRSNSSLLDLLANLFSE
jgi:hypothetical protein